MHALLAILLSGSLWAAPPRSADYARAADERAKASAAAIGQPATRAFLAREAESLYLAALELDCRAPVILPYLERDTRLSRGRYQKALKACARGYKPGDPERQTNLAILYQRLDDDAEGLSRLADALESDPAHARALEYLGDHRYWPVIGGKTRERLARVVSSGPPSEAYYRAALRVADGELRYNLAWSAKLTQGPEFAVAAAQALWERGSLDLAREFLEDAAKEFPDAAPARSAQAWLELSTGNYRGAVEAALKARARELSESERESVARRFGPLTGLEETGAEALRRGELETALRLLDVEGLERGRGSLAQEVESSASSHLYAKEWDAARAEVKTLLRLRPDSTSYAAAWAFVSLQSDHYSDAVDAYVFVDKTSGLDPADRRRLGEALLRRGDYARALEALGSMGDDPKAAPWLLAADYGARGWRALEETFHKRSLDRGLPYPEVRSEALDAVHAIVRSAASRAESSGAHYAALEHLSVLHAYLSDLRDCGNKCADSRWADEQAEEAWRRAIELYRALDVKPKPPRVAVELARRAQEAQLAGDSSGAARSFTQALDRAPWWGEGWFNFALVRGVHPNYYPVAIQMMERAARLAADPKVSALAEKHIARWRKDWAKLGCSEADLEAGACEALK